MSQSLKPAKTGLLSMPRLPVAGFLPRLIAFILDLILILAAIHLVSRTFPDLFWAMERWSGYFTSILYFLYLVIFNGPFGKGRTIGKMILGIYTSDYDGNLPTWRQSIQRTVILLPVFVSVPLAATFFGYPDSSMKAYLYSLFTHMFFISSVISTLIVIPFNPFRQGLHDFAAGTIVRKGNPIDAVPFAEMAKMIGPEWKTFHRQPQYSGLATIGLVLALLAYLQFPGNFPKAIQEYRNAIFELGKIDGFKGARIDSAPLLEDEYIKYHSNSGSEAPPPMAKIDSSTTETLRLVLPLTRDTFWGLDPRIPSQQAYAQVFLANYHKEVLPKLLAIAAATEGTNNTSHFTEWKNRPIIYRLQFIQQLSLTPYPPITSRIQYEYEKEFPPIDAPEMRVLTE